MRSILEVETERQPEGEAARSVRLGKGCSCHAEGSFYPGDCRTGRILTGEKDDAIFVGEKIILGNILAF